MNRVNSRSGSALLRWQHHKHCCGYYYFGLRLALSEISSLFGLSKYLDRTFAQRTGLAQVKSKSEVTHCKLHKQRPVQAKRPTVPVESAAATSSWNPARDDEQLHRHIDTPTTPAPTLTDNKLNVIAAKFPGFPQTIVSYAQSQTTNSMWSPRNSPAFPRQLYRTLSHRQQIQYDLREIPRLSPDNCIVRSVTGNKLNVIAAKFPGFPQTIASSHQHTQIYLKGHMTVKLKRKTRPNPRKKVQKVTRNS